MNTIVALDQGTTGSRAIVFDRQGRALGEAKQEFRQIFPRPGWVEHDPEEIWKSQSGVIAGALQQAGVTAEDVAAVGITNQRETTVLWERATGRPIANAIVWQDRRTAETCERLRADSLEDKIRAKTGLVLDAYFSATKVAWLLDHVDGARAAAERGELAFGTVDAWLAYRLTDGAVHATDVSNASRTLLFDIHRLDWDDELLGLFDVPRAVLPQVVASSQVLSEITADVGLAGVPLAGLIGDQQAATMGQVCIAPGSAKNTYGTGCFMLLNTGETAKASNHHLLTTVAWQRDGRTDYALEGSVFVGGAAIQWLRDGLGIIDAASEVGDLAASVEDNGGVYFVPALTGLGAPHWDPHARGTLVGLTRGTQAAHIARAALEGIAHQVADLAEAMAADAEEPLRELRVDGGAAASDFLMQFQADLLQVSVVRPTVLETTALGAAYMAGLAVGTWSSVDDIVANWQVDRRFEPQRSASDVQRLRGRWREAVERSRGWDRAAE
ncbi:MAG: glycerol kinase GlpK [Acidobacteriota bacterium]